MLIDTIEYTTQFKEVLEKIKPECSKKNYKHCIIRFNYGV